MLIKICEIFDTVKIGMKSDTPYSTRERIAEIISVVEMILY